MMWQINKTKHFLNLAKIVPFMKSKKKRNFLKFPPANFQNRVKVNPSGKFERQIAFPIHIIIQIKCKLKFE